MSMTTIRPAELPTDWTGWMVDITNPHGSEHLRGPMRQFTQAGFTVIIQCAWLERETENVWTRDPGQDMFQAYVYQYTLERDDLTGVITFHSLEYKETFTFTPPEPAPG